MTSFRTRFLCALLSIGGAAGLVTISSPIVAIGKPIATAPASVIAAARPLVIAHRG